jgi:hypothetical protein
MLSDIMLNVIIINAVIPSSRAERLGTKLARLIPDASVLKLFVFEIYECS